jgi:hypothetical protein
LGFLRVVGPHRWVRLLKVDVDCDGLDEIQGVILVKGQSEACLGVELGCLGMRLDFLGVILPGRNINLRVVINLKSCYSEAICLRHEPITGPLDVKMSWDGSCGATYDRVGLG